MDRTDKVLGGGATAILMHPVVKKVRKALDE
jgi:hypothetical protein